ncbi:MAG TPA: hypothetical protein VKP65_15905 [Rhodothermales bacterium]|nr:hypothetical protein [Rhodothermales bacterium]
MSVEIELAISERLSNGLLRAWGCGVPLDLVVVVDPPHGTAIAVLEHVAVPVPVKGTLGAIRQGLRRAGQSLGCSARWRSSID